MLAGVNAASQGGYKNRIDQRFAVCLVGGEAVELADHEHRGGDLLVGERIGRRGEFSSLNGGPQDGLGESGAGRAG